MKIKIFLKYAVLILFAIIISCKSPTQPGQIENQNSPSIIISYNSNSTLQVGDTLFLTLHVTDPKLKSGTIDFGDSSIIVVFSNLKPVLDTILIHMFMRMGPFNLTATFSDGDLITTKHLTIPVTYNPSPVITITPDKTTISLGDTLKLTLHATDITLSNGSINFNDGTIITFPHLYRSIDTTIMHVYSQLGTYSVSAAFSDGISTTSKSVSVSVQLYYTLSFKIGMSWRFSYNYHLEDAEVGVDTSKIGTHTWKIISSASTNHDTIFTIMQTTNDVVDIHNLPDIDTTYTTNDTSYFSISYSYSTVQWSWPTKYFGIETFSIPNHVFIVSYPVWIFNTKYDYNGPLSYGYDWRPMGYYYISETFSLIDFTKP
jgi:hypothetical protein